MPSQDIEIWDAGRLSYGQFEQGRPSYINAVLIQSCGVENTKACSSCRSKKKFGPFTTCVSLAGCFGNSCANCKWRDWASRCGGKEMRAPAEVLVEGSSRVEEVQEEGES